MGKKNFDDYGDIYIFLANRNYHPGEQVNGMVYVNLGKTFPAGAITLKLEGKEKFKHYWAESHQVNDGTNRTERVIKDDSEKKTAFKAEFPIASFPGQKIPAGQYQFPVCFVLPSNIPSSFNYKWKNEGKKCYAKIEYEMKVKLEAHGEDGDDLLKRKQVFIVNAPLKSWPESKSKSETKEITCYCCFGKGPMKISSHFDKDAYMPGETAQAYIEVENGSSYECEKITAELIQYIEMKGKRTVNLDKTLSSTDGDSVSAGKNCTGENARMMRIAINGVDQKDDDGNVFYNTTCSGKIIKCHYKLSIIGHMECKGCICDKAPDCDIPIQLYTPSMPTMAEYMAPTGWAPQMYPLYTADLGGAQMEGGYQIPPGPF
jgi:sporulation-control protein spo0M